MPTENPPTIPGRFAGQAAAVTGAADGIGKHVAARLAREGAPLTLIDHNQKLLNNTAATFASLGHHVTTAHADVSDEHQLAAALDQAASHTGKLDVAVHCAGIVGPNATKITDVETSQFDRVYEVNLRGSFLLTRFALKHMLPHGYGRILLFASIAGKEGNAGMAAYSATKAGVIALAKSAAKDVPDSGVTVNAIAPAVVRTAMVDALDPWQVDYMTSKIPMGRCGSLDEVTALATWIVSPEASFNTGATFDLSGGRAVY